MSQQKKRRPPRRKLPNPDHHSMHQQHHQIRAMNEHQRLPSYKSIMKEYQDKVASINFRNDMLQRQVASNYKNEFDRIRGLLEHTIMPDRDIRRLRTRGEDLQRLINKNDQVLFI